MVDICIYSVDNGNQSWTRVYQSVGTTVLIEQIVDIY